VEANDYLQQVEQQQVRVAEELRQRQRGKFKLGGVVAAPAAGVIEPRKGVRAEEDQEDEEFTAGAAVDYRITGFWRWKTVVVPPNVYVVHTRRGQAEPLHLGLGMSFRYNPATDAFLVIPAAVQTLLINAKCICAERQGVLVQAYVQWVVDDLRTAYRRLDFGDPTDPMRIVNVQLREQAEAAIKDKVAMMGIDDVLSDKQPIIEELTTRLRAVAEGTREGAATTGLGLKIVTVQIKEAVVSSTRLWENLQKPFRAEREKLARVAELDAQQEIARRELANKQERESAELEAKRRLDRARAEAEREAYDRDQSEKARRHQLEQAAEVSALAERAATEKARRVSDEELAVQQHELHARQAAREQEALARIGELERARAELDKQRAVAGAERDELVHRAECVRGERDVALFQKRREVENALSDEHVRAQLIARLPEIATALPRPQELRSISVGGADGSTLTGLLAGLLQTVEGALKRPAANGEA
jgi:hypothetical protein